MTPGEIEMLVKQTLYEVAPDLEGEPLEPDKPYNEQFEFDSMDFLNFVTGLHRATGLELPEKDYPRLATLAGAVKYLAGKLGASSP
jgi:acyl carrier protein